MLRVEFLRGVLGSKNGKMPMPNLGPPIPHREDLLFALGIIEPFGIPALSGRGKHNLGNQECPLQEFLILRNANWN